MDLTKYMCTVGEREPDQHIRIDSANPTTVHMDVSKKK